jgi:hypothetical protein
MAAHRALNVPQKADKLRNFTLADDAGLLV